VILLRGHALGFGKLRDRGFDFRSGLNLVFAANEGGKTTLQRFLVAMLYGQLRSDLKVQRRLDPWVEQYKPWRAQEYGGILWVRLADGREMEIHRSFGKEETRVEIRAASGEDITRQYEQQRNGEVLFARSHFGMPKEIFESVGMIRENRVAEISGYESIRDRIANLAQSGDEELSMRQSLAKIQEKLDSIGSERAPTKPYKQAMDLVQSLQEERKALEERRTQFQSWVEDRNRIAGEISTLERELLKIQATILAARKREIEERIRSLEEIQSEISTMAATIESLGARTDFPADLLEELNQLVGASESTGKHLSEIRAEKDAALSEFSKAESERKALAAYAPLAQGADAEKITDLFVSYLSISLQKDGLEKTVGRMHDEAGVFEKRLAELSPAFLNPQNDWQRMALEAAENEQLASQNCAEIGERIAIEKANLAAITRTTSNKRVLGFLLLILAAVPAGIRYLAGINLLSRWVDIGFGAVFSILAIIFWIAAAKTAKGSRGIRDMLRSLDSELDSVRLEGGKKRKALLEAMKGSGFQTLDDFLAAAKNSEQDRHKLADLQARTIEAENQRERLQAQSGEMFQQLKEGLARVGLSCSPGNLKFQIDLFRSNLRRYRELDAVYLACQKKADSLKFKDEELATDYDQKRARMQSLLDQAQVKTPEQFCEECVKRQKLLELLDKQASRTREFSRLAGNQTLVQWKDQLQELIEQSASQAAIEQAVPEQEVTSKPYLPYLPSVAEAEEQEKRVGAQLASAREEYARAMERVKHAFQNFRPAYEIDEDFAIAERDFADLETNRRALEIALDTLEKLSRQQQEVLAPQLNAAVEQRFLRLCGERYEEVKVDPDFQVWVRETETAVLRLAEHLSRGTQDQIYFSMRFGIMDLVSNTEEPCPGFLDEPFAAYDQTRLREAFEVLAEETKRRQVFLFTCREDLLELALSHNANIIQLEEIRSAGVPPTPSIA
jgi:uncharacterized protein YhaN